MLRKRILSGLVLGLSLLFGIAFLSTPVLAAALGVLLLIGGWEWAALTGVRSDRDRLLYLLALIAIMMLLYFVPSALLGTLVWGGALVVWLAILVLETNYVRPQPDSEPRWQRPLRYSGLLLIPAAWLAMVELHQDHPWFLLFLLLISAAADTFAYFAGKRFGDLKLAPELSPGKTREGFFGGMVGVLFITLAFVYFMDMEPGAGVSFSLLCLLCGVMSVVGDLFESLMKREVGAKDSGWIIPGHGGVLDRFDSHIAVAPVFVVGLQWIAGISVYG